METVSVQTELNDNGDNEELVIDSSRKKRITYQPSNPTIQSLHYNYSTQDLILDPDFQRNFVWNKQKASNLIESIILNIPLPLIFTAKVGDKEEVVDGQQRLTSIFSFMEGKFPDGTPFKLSKKLKVVGKEIGGKLFTELDEEYKKEIQRRALPFITIDEECQEDIKFEMFERLNTNITPLNAQELRNCLYRGPYNDFLKSMADYDKFQDIVNKPKGKERMWDVELILMFCSFCHLNPDLYNKSLKQTLNMDMKKHKSASDEDLKELEYQFKKSVGLINTIFGENAFNIYNVQSGFSKQFNQGLYQILMYWFVPYKENQVIPYIDLIREELLNLEVHNSEFLDTLTGSGTNSPKKIRKKFEIWGNTIKGILNYPHNEPRAFSFKLKKELWEKDPICQICSQRIISIDDAEIDHIICYWKGGKTIPENARLTHRICNRKKGGNS